MKERPILFSAPMVRAILDDRKTQTRRIVKPQPNDGLGQMVNLGDAEWGWDDGDLSGLWRCPYGVPGDRLWVKETLRRTPHLWTYAADGTEVGWPARADIAPKKRDIVTAIHCSRAASRITLEITEVRVERLQDISRGDAAAEGLVQLAASGRYAIAKGDQYFGGASFDPREVYSWLWESINGEGSWLANPWVWVVVFRRVAQEARAA